MADTGTDGGTVLAALWLALVSLCLGSFFTVVVARYGTGQGLWGRSRCGTCSQTIAWHDLVPLFSWCRLKGRCRQCAHSINGFYPLVEAAALLAGVSAVVVFDGSALLVSLLLGWTLVLLATFDARHFLLPFPLTLGLAAAGFAAGLMGVGEDFTARLVGWGVGFAVLGGVRLLYRRTRGREGLGGGDVWLFAAAGAWVGWAELPWVLLLSTCGAILYLVVTRGAGRMRPDEKIPFGTWLCAALWSVYLAQAALP